MEFFKVGIQELKHFFLDLEKANNFARQNKTH